MKKSDYNLEKRQHLLTLADLISLEQQIQNLKLSGQIQYLVKENGSRVTLGQNRCHIFREDLHRYLENITKAFTIFISSKLALYTIF